MNEELRKLLDQINEKKAQAKALIEEDKLDEAKAVRDEIKNLQDKFDLLADLEAQKTTEGKDSSNPVIEDQPDDATAFTNAIKAAWKHTPLSEKDQEVINKMSEGSDEDGGLTVPPDIRTQIHELRRSEDALETLVNVEHVNTNKGSRVIEVEAEQTPFDNVDEDAEFPEESTPQFRNVKYEIKKKGGILKVTQELLSDSSENIIGYLRRWISKKAKATRNFMIIKKIKELCEGLEVSIKSIDTLKDIFNVMLDPAIAAGAIVLTNQSGFNWLDKQKDSRGDYILQPDPTKPTQKLLFGTYPVKVVSRKTLGNVNGKAPIVCGDLKEAITIFDRETLTVDISDVAAGMWERDQTGIKVRERLDIQSVDENAIIMGYVDVENSEHVDMNEDGKYSEKELNKLSKTEIVELAKSANITLTTTEENTKAEIIADFLEKQK